MLDLFNRAELKLLATEITASATTVLAGMPLHDDVRKEYAVEIGNNATAAVTAAMGELLPYVDGDLRKIARSCIWVNQSEGTGRAGLLDTAAGGLTRNLASGFPDNADAALGLLERRLFALFVAVRQLRKLPAECRDTHRVIEDKHGPICARCGERPEV